MLQTYQAMYLVELGKPMPPDSPLAPLLNEVRVATDYILHVTVVVQRHLWLTLSDVPDRDRAVYLNEPLCAEGLFGQSVDTI